jgi:hypothetical protein
LDLPVVPEAFVAVRQPFIHAAQAFIGIAFRRGTQGDDTGQRVDAITGFVQRMPMRCIVDQQ